MMDSAFFRNRWNPTPRSRSSPIMRGIPVQNPSSSPSPSSPSPKPARKVISVPVHFIGSEEVRSAAAVKIQKVFRGFLVKKSAKRIFAIRREVDEIERKISAREVVDLMRRDQKERLKVNEMLMALLFRLDSVPGVDAGVRECRRAVIKKAIRLQEMVDAIAADETLGTDDQQLEESSEDSAAADGTLATADQMLEDSSEKLGDSASDSADRILEVGESKEDFMNLVNETKDDVPNSDDSHANLGAENPEKTLEIAEPMECAVTLNYASNPPEEQQDNPSGDQDAIDFEKARNLQIGDDEQLDCCMKEDHYDSGEDHGVKTIPVVSCVEKHQLSPECTSEIQRTLTPSLMMDDGQSMEGTVENDASEKQETGEEALIQTEEREGKCKDEIGDENMGIMEKMVKENEKLMGMVTELCQRSALQTRVLGTLTQRVEQLERAFLCEKLRKKKKRRSTMGTVDGSDHSSL